MTSYDIIWHHMTSYDMTRHAPVVGNGYDLDTPGSQARRRSCIRRAATAEHVPVRVSLSERRGFAARTRTHYKNTAGGRSSERRRLGTTRDALSMGQARRRSCIRTRNMRPQQCGMFRTQVRAKAQRCLRRRFTVYTAGLERVRKRAARMVDTHLTP